MENDMKKTISLLTVAVIIILTLTACFTKTEFPVELPTDSQELANLLEKNGYAIKKYTREDDLRDICKTFGADSNGIGSVVVTARGNSPFNNVKMGYFFYFDLMNSAKSFYEIALEFSKTDYEFTEFVENFTVERNGTVVYYGCKDNWDLFK